VHTFSTYGISEHTPQHCFDTLGLLIICLSLIYSFCFNDSSGSTETQHQRQIRCQIRYHHLILFAVVHTSAPTNTLALIVMPPPLLTPPLLSTLYPHLSFVYTIPPTYAHRRRLTLLWLHASTKVLVYAEYSYYATYNSLVLIILADVRFGQTLKSF